MNIYISNIIKTLISLLIQTYIIFNSEDIKRAVYLIISLVIYNFLFLVYVKYKSDVFKSRFLRRNYKPSLPLLAVIYAGETGITLTLYYYYYSKVVYLNLLVLLISYLQRIIDTKKRKTCPLEKNEEFFKIAFLTANYKDDLKRGEVVQILDKKGENIIVRSSTGRKFTIPGSMVNDDIDLVI